MTEIRTLEDVQRHNQKVAEWRSMPLHADPMTGRALVINTTIMDSRQARPEYVPVRKRRQGPNRLETAYGQNLEAQKRAGEILDYAYERVTLKIAHDCRLTVDWHVIARDGVTEFHECKGPHAWEDSIIKLKVAATQLPHYRFFLVRKDRTGFTVNAVGDGSTRNIESAGHGFCI